MWGFLRKQIHVKLYLDYADDISLQARDIDETQLILDTIVTEGSIIDLTVNDAKTELMKIRAQDTRCVSIGGYNLQEVNKFHLLWFPHK